MAAKRSRKSQDGQRKRARTQGRASQTKQNHTQKSRNQTGQRASLDALPGELLEGICQGLIRPAGSSSRENKRMLNFRLTCKSIDAKTVNFFAKSAFSQMIVLDRLMWYRRLLLISNLPRIAPHIRKIWFMTSDEMSAGDYRALQLRERSSRGLDERRNIREEMHQAELEQDTKAFYENSPIFAFMLVNILLKLTNVREFRIDSPDSIDYYQRIRRQQGSSLPSSTQWFQTLMSCFYEADVRPHTLTLPFGFRVRDGVEGVNIQALAAPAVVLDCFSELRELTIRVETKSFQWKNPATWTRHLSNFLQHTPQLMDLTFGVEEHTFDGTSEVFTTVAQEVILPKLKRLFMDCFECHGVDLKDFLGNHPKLESLKLHNLNVIWHDSFSSVLGSLEKHHNLDFFWCWQIAEKWRRVIFRTWGDISVGDHQCIDCISDDRTCEDGDLIEVDRPKRLSAKAQASWENVAEKIGQLREDMEVTDRPMYLRDFEDHGFWYDQDLADDSDSD